MYIIPINGRYRRDISLLASKERRIPMEKKSFILMSVVVMTVALSIAPLGAWELPPDRGTMGKDAISEILAGNEYPETTGYTQKIEFVDFTSYGKKFTQVVVRLEPERPRIRNGKKLVVVGAEPGSEYAMDFIETVEGKDAMGVWLAKRGITFIALTRVGRWNFLASDGSGSWKEIPLEDRMPIFDRNQKVNWSPNDYIVQKLQAATTTAPTAVFRFPKPGTELYRQMLAANPVTMVMGYNVGLNHVLPPAEREKSTVLYWGHSTGGPFLWPLANYFKPDGFMGFGTSSTGLAYLYKDAAQGSLEMPYVKSCLRVRQRGKEDLDFYTRHIKDEAIKEAWYQSVLKSPRFKSVEDAEMMFNSGALAEWAVRLWMADFLPAEYKKGGFGKFMNDIMEPSFPPPTALKDLPVLEVNGTLDEVLPPKTVDLQREIMEPYCGKYRVARIQDFHHYFFEQEPIKVVGSLWLRFIDSGYFDAGK